MDHGQHQAVHAERHLRPATSQPDRLKRLLGYGSSLEIFLISPLRQRLAKLAQSSQLLLP